MRHATREKMRVRQTKTIRYTGGNNQTYTKECMPLVKDVRIMEATEVLLPITTAKYELAEVERSIEVIDSVESRMNSPRCLSSRLMRCVSCYSSTARACSSAVLNPSILISTNPTDISHPP